MRQHQDDSRGSELIISCQSGRIVRNVRISGGEKEIALSDINVAAGNWLVANCADFPSENHCQLVIMGPEGQMEDLVSAAMARAIGSHGHEDSPDLRTSLAGLLRPVAGIDFYAVTHSRPRVGENRQSDQV